MAERIDAVRPAWVADRAMGLELEAMDIENELEWAEAQGRQPDAATLRGRLGGILADLASLSSSRPAAPGVRIHAPRASEAA